MKCVLYVRVSTSRQETDNQLPDLYRYAESKSLEVVKVYAENETAWKRGHQHELEQCKLAARRHEFDVLLIWALDRLTRGGIPATFAILDEFESLGIKVFSDQERWLEQINDANRPLFIAIKGWMAKEESDRRRERINAGIARVRATGKHVGRPLGRKDSRNVHRKRSSYFAREEKRREAKNLAQKFTSRETASPPTA